MPDTASAAPKHAHPSYPASPPDANLDDGSRDRHSASSDSSNLTSATNQHGDHLPSALTRWHPFAAASELCNRIDRMFDDLADRGERNWTPPIDVQRDNGGFFIHADGPRIKTDDIKVGRGSL